jgi:hypothetical protein
MEKEASRFTNKKCTLKNARGSKTSDEKRGTTLCDSEMDPRKIQDVESVRNHYYALEGVVTKQITQRRCNKTNRSKVTYQNKSLEGDVTNQIARR